jgi:transposase
VPAPGQAKKVAMIGLLDHTARRLIVQTSRSKRSTDFIAVLQALDGLYGPRPGVRIKPVVVVLDNGPIHVSKATLAALAARAHWLTVEWLPKYAPELNDIEAVWHDLKAHHLAHQTFTDADALDRAIHAAVAALNTERNVHSLANRRISAWTSLGLTQSSCGRLYRRAGTLRGCNLVSLCSAARARFPLWFLSGCGLDRLGDDSPLLALDRGGGRARPCSGGAMGHAQKKAAWRSLHARSPVSRKRLPRRSVQAQDRRA